MAGGRSLRFLDHGGSQFDFQTSFKGELMFRKAVVAAVLSLAVVGGVAATHSQHHDSSWSDSADAYYTNSDGVRVHGPMFADHKPDGATAHCVDGSYSFSQHRRGTCSYHGGVVQWY